MTSDGTNTYAWDAENRMIKITYPGTGNYSQFTYDALGHCVQITETSGGTITSTKQFVWCGDEMCEARNASSTVTAQYFPRGEIVSGTAYYYTKDHLDSIREMTSSSGAIMAQYGYDFYGQVFKTNGSQNSDFQYAGYYYHQPSNLSLTLNRAYSASLSRWINRDPIGEAGGVNLYEYVNSNPISETDATGTAALCIPTWSWPFSLPILFPSGNPEDTPPAGGGGGEEGGGEDDPEENPITKLLRNIVRNKAGGGGGGGRNEGYYEDPSLRRVRRVKSSRASKPSNAPKGTKPINKYPGLTTEDIHRIKPEVGAKPTDYTGISPNGDVITTDSNGHAINHGPYTQYLP